MSAGNFFEDFRLGQVIEHATPRTVTEGDRALYQAFYPSRFALASSAPFAASCGLAPWPVEELIGFHIGFGKTVQDVSLNAVANLGYAELRFRRPAVPGDTISSRSTVIGLREASNHRTGIVWVRSEARNQRGEIVVDWARWVMVRKRDEAAPAPEPVVPELAPALSAADLVVPEGLDFRRYDFAAAGSGRRLGDYAIGEKIDHTDGATIEEAEHMMATRLWQNTARVHFDATARDELPRLVYGGHVISIARALSVAGLANAQPLAAINAGVHVAPAQAGHTVFAWSEVLDKAETAAPGVGAIRLRLVATKGRDPTMTLRDREGRYAPGVLLDLDLWAFHPV